MSSTAFVWYRSPLGFIAGFISTLTFHQATVAVLWALGAAPFVPYSMLPTAPFGVPAFLSLAFWGGVWGILFAWVDVRLPSGNGYWPVAFVLGAVPPTLVALLVVLPLKGEAMGGGWHLGLWLFGLLVNGVWGVGTGIALRLERLLARRMGAASV
jgi:hypothetical protein